MGAPTPPLIPQAFADDAGPSFINDIPDTSADLQRATWSDGFPPQTMTPIGAGGKPMLGPDMNGVLNVISAWAFAQQAGQIPSFSSTVSTAISGYKQGAILAMADGTGFWLSLIDDNTNNPDTGGGNATWLPLSSYGYQTVVTTGGVVNLTSTQARRDTIIITGALIANAQIVFPATLRSWLVVNNTSGAFAVNVRTAGGSGVNVPPGGFAAPVEVYGNGADLFPTVAPLNLPSAVAPTPNTYVVRDGSGDVFARYLNSSAGVDNPAIVNVFTEAGAPFAANYLRKNSLANFMSQLVLSQLAGQVSAAQVPANAVTQYVALLLANAALTGTPTAPTPSAGDSSTRVATTAFAGGTLIVGAGQISYTAPGGAFIIKGGFVQGSAGIGFVSVAFTAAFPNACLAALTCTANRTGAGSSGTGYVSNLTAAGFDAFLDAQQSGAGSGSRGGYWIAIGR